MKKAVRLLALLVILTLLLSACGTIRRVEEELPGTWMGYIDELSYVKYTFSKDGTYTRQAEHYVYVGMNHTVTGTYEVRKNVIVCTRTSGNVTELTYNYDRNEGLTFAQESGLSFTKIS